MAEYSKEKIAFMQLEGAIELIDQKKYIPAITLGSAAEELFAIFLKQYAAANKRRIPTTAELDEGMFELSKEITGIKNYMSYRNNTRNELKHHGDSNKKIVKGNFKLLASMHVAGAIINYKLRTGHLPKNKTVTDYCLRVGIS